MLNFNEEYIIFLDIDGVMNDSKREPDNFLPEAVSVLNTLFNKYNAKVVLSSSWREYFTFNDLKDLFEQNGLLIKIIDKTPVYICDKKINKALTLEEISNLDIQTDISRDFEIMNYIKVHNICHYVILDDFDFDDEELKKHLVQTHYWGDNTGLKWHHLEKIEEIFKSS